MLPINYIEIQRNQLQFVEFNSVYYSIFKLIPKALKLTNQLASKALLQQYNVKITSM